jgi:hypothetical protein
MSHGTREYVGRLVPTGTAEHTRMRGELLRRSSSYSGGSAFLLKSPAVSYLLQV